MNLYTYCGNNPIRYIDPSGHSYATLPNGDKMSINSASDAKKFEEKKARMKKGAPGCGTNTPIDGCGIKHLNLSSQLSDEKKDFAQNVFDSALVLEYKIGVPAEIVTAQACLETGWGENIPIDRNTGQYSYNIFGIKGTGTAGSVNCGTREHINGEDIYINDDFAAYNSFKECLSGYDDFLTNRSLYPYDDLFGNMNVEDWAYGLESHHYATDPHYAELLLNIIDVYLGVE